MNKIIDGVECVSRDVVYSSDGKGVLNTLASESENKEISYSWTEDGTQVVESNTEDKQFSEVAEDREYAGLLSSRLTMLRMPLYVQLRDLYNDHSRMYRSKGSKMKKEDIDILLDDYRYELHRIIAKAKDLVISSGGNLDSLLRLSSFGGGVELNRAAKSLTVLFKRIETAYSSFGYVPKEYQTKMNEALSILISHFILDIYGPELERKKTATNVFENSGAESK